MLAAEEAMSERKVAGFHVGVTDHAKGFILGEIAIPEGVDLTLGSDDAAVVPLPAEYGIGLRRVIHDCAIEFEPGERLAAYRSGRAEILDVASPAPIEEPLILELGRIRVLVRRVWLDPTHTSTS